MIFFESLPSIGVESCEELGSNEEMYPQDEVENYDKFPNNNQFVDSDILFESSAIEFFFEEILRLAHEAPRNLINNSIKKYGYKLVHETEDEIPFQVGYESLRKKINRTKNKTKRKVLIEQLCQLYIDHAKKPKSTFKHIDMYNRMKFSYITL